MDSFEWVPVSISTWDSTSVTLDWKACSGKWLMGYRYAWRDVPCPYKQCAVYSVENELPLLPRIVSGILGTGGKNYIAVGDRKVSLKVYANGLELF